MSINNVSDFLANTSAYEFVEGVFLFNEGPIASVLKDGSAIEIGQYGFPIFPKVFPSGLISLSPRWTDACYGEFYAKYYSHLYNLENKPDVGVGGIKQNYEKIANWLQENTDLSDRQSVFEVGSGPAIGLSHLMGLLSIARGYVVEGSLDSIQSIDTFPNIKLLGNSIESIDSTCPTFDLCILRHVVEHMLNPISEMQKLAAFANSDTLFYVAVPDALNPKTVLRDYTDWTEYWFRVPHVHYFNRFTLSEVLRLSGFKILCLEEIDNEIRVLCTKASNIQSGSSYLGPDVLRLQVAVLENLLGSQDIPACHYDR